MPRRSPRKNVSPRKLSNTNVNTPTKKSTESPKKRSNNNKEKTSNKKANKDASDSMTIRNENTKSISNTQKSPRKANKLNITKIETEPLCKIVKTESQSVSKRKITNPQSVTKEPPQKKKKNEERPKTKETNITEKVKSSSKDTNKILDTPKEAQVKERENTVKESNKSDSLDKQDKIEIEVDLSKPMQSKTIKEEKKKTNNLEAKASKAKSPKKLSKEKPKPKTSKKSAAKRKRDESIESDEQDTDGNLLRVDNEYIADGFKDDCEFFIQKCKSVSKLNFEKFSIIWKSMGFANIYKGRQTGAEMAELSDEVIHIAKTYMLATDRTFETNIAGLFLVYGLLNLQPYKGFSALRLVPRDVPAILAIEAEARKQKRHDIIYVLGHILTIGPCQFHVLERECGLELPIRKYFDGSIVVNDANTQPIGVLSHNLEALSLMKDLTLLDHRYDEAKKQLQDRLGSDPSLNFTTFTADRLEETIQDLIPSFLRERKGKGQETDRVTSVKNIKDKAMALVVSPMKHLTGINERSKKASPTTPTSPKGKSKYRALKGSFSGRTLTTGFEYTNENEESKDILDMSAEEIKELTIARKRGKLYKPSKAVSEQRCKDLLKYAQSDRESEQVNDISNINHMPILIDQIEENNSSMPIVFDHNTIEIIKINDQVKRPIVATGPSIEIEIIDYYDPGKNVETKDCDDKIEKVKSGDNNDRTEDQEKVSKSKDQEIDAENVNVGKGNKKTKDDENVNKPNENLVTNSDKTKDRQTHVKNMNDGEEKNAKTEDVAQSTKYGNEERIKSKDDERKLENNTKGGKEKIVKAKDAEKKCEEKNLSSDSEESDTTIEQLATKIKNKKILDRRGFKRNRVKSALKRLGILDVADFKTEELK